MLPAFFDYRDQKLWCEDVELASICERFGTPTYVYSKALLPVRCKAILTR